MPECLDAATVKLLCLRMPAHSARDAFFIDEAWQASAVFSAVSERRLRSDLRARVLACEKVLTFSTFHADVALLELCHNPLRQLWPGGKCSLREACRASFARDGKAFLARYVEIWLYTIKNYPNLNLVRSHGLKKVGHKAPTESMLHGDPAVSAHASFVHSRGFRSEVIESLRTRRKEVKKGSETPRPASIERFEEVRLQDRSGRPPMTLFHHWQGITLDDVLNKGNAKLADHASPLVVARSFLRCFFESGKLLDPKATVKSKLGSSFAVTQGRESSKDDKASRASRISFCNGSGRSVRSLAPPVRCKVADNQIRAYEAVQTISNQPVPPIPRFEEREPLPTPPHHDIPVPTQHQDSLQANDHIDGAMAVDSASSSRAAVQSSRPQMRRRGEVAHKTPMPSFRAAGRLPMCKEATSIKADRITGRGRVTKLQPRTGQGLLNLHLVHKHLASHAK